jgi:hypothetical protein
MPGTVTPGNGGLSAYIKAAHDMLIGSASWKAYMIAAHDDLTNTTPNAGFLKYIRQLDTVLDGDDYDDTEIQSESETGGDEIQLQDMYPLVVVYEEDDFAWTPIGQCSTTQFEIGGTVSMVFMDLVKKQIGDAPGLYDARLRFANWIDGVVADWNGTVLPTHVRSIALTGAITRAVGTQRPIEDFWMAKLSISFGTEAG